MSFWRWFLIGLLSCFFATLHAESLDDELLSIISCCPYRHGLLSNHSCVLHDTGSLKPSIYVNESATYGNEVVSEADWDFTCASDQVLQQVSLDDEAQLHVFGDEVFLYWLSPQTDSWLLVESYCVAASAEAPLDGAPHYVVEFCYEDPIIQWEKDEAACQNATCVRKCCPSTELFNGTCVPPSDSTQWEPRFHSADNHEVIVNNPLDLLIVYGAPQCPVSLIYDDYTLLETGELDLPEFPHIIPASRYCLDMFVQPTGEVKERSVICQTEEYSGCWWRHFLVDTLFMSISCVFLAITWLVYVCIGELRTNTHGRCMISFITALLVAFVTILVIRNHRDNFSSLQCSFTAALAHLSILAAFFWLNVLCYHIWNCLRSGRKRDESSVFVAYCIYGWGCPLVVSLVGVVLDATKADVLRPDFIPPHCWFKDRTTKWVYQYGFMLVLLLVNLAFFLSSALMLSRRLRQTQDLRHHREGLCLYLKLFIIMGITWLMEMITWLLEEDPCTTWVTILDGITALHGLYIFLVTVCFGKDLRIFRKCCGKTQYDVDGNTISCTRDNFVELLDGQK